MDWIVETILPREVRKLAQHIEDNNTQHQLAIEAKDNDLEIVNNDLQENAYEIQAKDYQLQQRYVDHSINPDKDNIIIIIRKHRKEAVDKYHNLPYYIARIQIRKRYVKLHWFERHFPNHEIIVELDNPNSSLTDSKKKNIRKENIIISDLSI